MPTDRSSLAYLEAMGVDLWIRRDVSGDESGVEAVNELVDESVDESVDVADESAPPPAGDEPVEVTAEPETQTDVAAAAAAPADTVTVDSPADATQVPLEPETIVESPATEPADDETQDPVELIARADLESLQTMVSGCERCPLSRTRNKTVFGSGNPDADWLFVGEAPGRDEDRQGEAFVGKAGQLLNAMLFALGLTRDDVFIANVLKCRPPDNRDPMGEEVVRCEPYLHRQVDLVQPKVIVAMGRFAAQALLRSGDNISRMRGQQYEYRETGIPLVVTYHPAYLLRTPDQKGKVWDDLLQARRMINGG